MSREQGTMLQRAVALSPRQLEAWQRLAEAQNVSLWHLLVVEKGVPEESVTEAFSRWLKVPRVRLAKAKPEARALGAVPAKLARQHTCLPLRFSGSDLVVAIASPLDQQAVRAVETAADRRVQLVIAGRTEILGCLDEYYQEPSASSEALPAIFDESSMLTAERDVLDLDLPGVIDGNDVAPVVGICNAIIRDAIKARSSDIHIEPGRSEVRVRLRVDGVLREHMPIPRWLHPEVVARLKILAKLDVARRRLPQDGRMRVKHEDRRLDIRVSTLPTYHGEKVVLRILGTSSVPDLEGLGLTPADCEIIDASLQQPQGLILVTGPTGAGKSTTLYSMLLRRHSDEVNIVTIEDPIEYQIPGITQVQVDVKAGLTFARSLRAILRQDPDIILVGEIRDPETAEIVFQAAMTGHLVFSTLHTKNSFAAIARLLDLGVKPLLMTSGIGVVVAQRLTRRVCQHCRQEYTPASQTLKRLRIDGAAFPFYRGLGCEGCNQTGYAGRLGIFEMLQMSARVKELIHSHAPESEIRNAAVQGATRLLRDDALEKVRAGLTTVEEMSRVIEIETEDERHCPTCLRLIPAGLTACRHCEGLMSRVCRGCGEMLKLTWRTCPSCQEPVYELEARSAPELTPPVGVESVSRPDSTSAELAFPPPRKLRAGRQQA